MKADPKKAAKARQAKARARKDAGRAAFYYCIYYDMGPERSLTSLLDHVTEMGLKISIQSLKRYSTKYDWQQRLAEQDAQDRLNDAEQSAKDTADRRRRQSSLGRNIQALASGGIAALAKILSDQGTLSLSPFEIAHLARAGAELENRAAGEPTTRHEISVVVYNVMIARIAAIFLQVNDINPHEGKQWKEERKRAFALAVDACQPAAFAEGGLLEEGKG